MKRLLEAFAQFLNENPEYTDQDIATIDDCLKTIMDADPEKVVLRQALLFYANENNWPYETHSPDGVSVIGMDAQEALDVANMALNSSQRLRAEVMSTILEDGSIEDVFKQNLLAG
jgi:hypothetical protein